MTTAIAPRLARNSLYYALKSVVALGSLLLVTPYIIGVVGTELFGVWALAAVVTSYAQLSDFGIGESVVRNAADYYARRDGEALNRLVGTVLIAYLALAVLIGGLLYLALPVLARDLLRIPATYLDEAVLIFRLSVAVFFFNLVMGVFAALVVATQQMGYATSVNIASTCLGAAGTFFFLWQGLGLRGLVLTNAIVAVFVACLNLLLAKRLFPALCIRPWRWADREMLRHVWGYSWKVQTSNLAQLLVFQLDRILLSRYLGLEAVALYEIGSNIALYARTFITALFSPMLPAAAVLHAGNERELLAGLYRRACKFLFLIAVPFCLLLVGLAQPFIRLWMGPGFELAALTLQLLMPVYLVNVLTVPGVFILNGINRPEVAMRAAVCAGLVNIVACLVLVKAIGYFGLIAGVAISLILAAGYFIGMLHRTLPELDRRMYGDLLFKPLVLSLPMAGVLCWFDVRFPIDGVVMLGAAGGVYVLVVGGLLLVGGYLDEFEKQQLRELLPWRRSNA